MKTLRNTVMLMLLSAGFAYSQNITVQGEKKLNSDFTKYKTFGWIQSDKATNRVIAYSYEEFAPLAESAVANEKASRKERKRDKSLRNKDIIVYSYYYTIPSTDPTINSALINSVEDEMAGRGYRKDEVSPDLLVSFKIFDQSTKIKGYNAPPTALQNNEEVHLTQDTVTYKLKPGTVLISLIDAKTNSVVWEGFASGVARENDVINDQLKVKEAINLIFKKYEFRGDKYSMNN